MVVAVIVVHGDGRRSWRRGRDVAVHASRGDVHEVLAKVVVIVVMAQEWDVTWWY